MSINLARRCPVCGATSGSLLHHQVFLAPAEVHSPGDVDVVACGRCGTCFSDLQTKQSVLDDTYRDHSKYADTSLYAEDEASRRQQAPTDAPWDLQRLDGTASWLAERFLLDRRVLDAGCATGALLGFLKRRGFSDLVGLDPSPVATATARRAYGVDTVTGSFFSPPPNLGTFDLVVLSHVLEHLEDVPAAIASMWDLTKPGGSVYIEVPDAEHYVDHLVAPFHDFNTEHINHFSARTLQLAMELAGFETATIERKEVLCSPTDLYPATFGLFTRPSVPAPAPEIERDDELVEALRRYVDESGELMASIGDRVRVLVGNRPVVVWGAGQLSMKLLADLRPDVHVVALVDTSREKWGQHFGDLVVIDPDQLAADTATPVLITSIHHEASIEASIRSRFPKRELIRLRV